MATLATYPHIQADAAGAARVGGSRYKVLHLAGEHFHYGWSAEEILRQHPDLRPEEVYSALAFFYDHYDEFVAKLKETAGSGGSEKPVEALSRDELLRRKKLAEPS